jgi:hypothetical protein
MNNYITGLILASSKSNIVVFGVNLVNYQEFIILYLCTQMKLNPHIILLILLFL